MLHRVFPEPLSTEWLPSLAQRLVTVFTNDFISGGVSQLAGFRQVQATRVIVAKRIVDQAPEIMSFGMAGFDANDCIAVNHRCSLIALRRLKERSCEVSIDISKVKLD